MGRGRGSETKVSCFEFPGEPTARMTGFSESWNWKGLGVRSDEGSLSLAVEEADARGTETAPGHAAVSTVSTENLLAQKPPALHAPTLRFTFFPSYQEVAQALLVRGLSTAFSLRIYSPAPSTSLC